MSIPLDRLYNHIDKLSQSVCEDCLVIYRFYPHGSKNLENLKSLKFDKESKTWAEWQIAPLMICHDQEPLIYDLYSDQVVKQYTFEKYSGFENRRYNIDMISKMHLRATAYYPLSCYDLTMLTHSEKNSTELIKYENNGFVGVYWWSHAVIARDWFRYAEHITQQKQIQKTFLIYNRAWSGTREYRLYFTELLIDLRLQDHCQTTVNPVEPELGIHYKLHKFSNANWRPTQVLENYFPENTAKSSASADFDIEDYEATDIEVVLETLFDDSRLHLTEKSLRPIACGQPFMLAGTQGSLEYLRSYGFKTFGSIWDEYYDCINDPQERLVYMVSVMRQIANWTLEERADKMTKAQAIADYNKNLFFSQSWQDSILQEYQTNFKSAWEKMQANRTGKYFTRLRELAKIDPEWDKILNADLPWRTQEDVQRVANWIKNPT